MVGVTGSIPVVPTACAPNGKAVLEQGAARPVGAGVGWCLSDRLLGALDVTFRIRL